METGGTTLIFCYLKYDVFGGSEMSVSDLLNRLITSPPQVPNSTRERLRASAILGYIVFAERNSEKNLHSGILVVIFTGEKRWFFNELFKL